MIRIIDYGVGNIFSLRSSFKSIGQEVVLTSDPLEIEKADKLILPGVGAFGDAMNKLEKSGLKDIVLKKIREGTPILGICLGMQLLFDKSYEYGTHDGLGLISGEIIPMKGRIPKALKVPQMGWNSLEFTSPKHELFKYINNGDYVYFVHSYFGTSCDEDVIATTEYGMPLTAAVAKDNIMGVQFHPEKSGEVGLKIIKGFCEI